MAMREVKREPHQEAALATRCMRGGKGTGMEYPHAGIAGLMSCLFALSSMVPESKPPLRSRKLARDSSLIGLTAP